MSHEQGEGRDESRTATGSGNEYHDPAASADPQSAGADERPRDRRVRSSECQVSPPRNSVEDVSDTIDGEVLPPTEARRIGAVVSQWSGDLPHPDDAERYEQLQAGTFDRLLALNERRMGVIERDQELAFKREQTVGEAVSAEADVKRSLASADAEALRRGQWMALGISLCALLIAGLGLILGYPVALAALLVPVVQIAGQLIRTVTNTHNSSSGMESTPRHQEEFDEPV
ncbi:MAG: hypothetical protein QM662_08485 [Gordonia sp. (in: high G+C Gram-positive bacteria)]